MAMEDYLEPGVSPWAVAAMRAARLSRQEAQAFADLYQQHAREEDEVVYPHARHLAGELLQAIGRRMAERRGVH